MMIGGMKKTELNLKPLLIWGIVSVILLSQNYYSQENLERALGQIDIRVTSFLGSPLSGAKVTFESHIGRLTATMQPNGTSTVGLMPGKYSVEIAPWIGNLEYSKNEIYFDNRVRSYFRGSFRSSIIVRPNDSKRLNISLVESGTVSNESYDEIQSFLQVTDVPLIQKRETEKIFLTDGSRFISIDYGKRETNKNNDVVYSADIPYSLRSINATPRGGVILAFGYKTIYADMVVYNECKRKLELGGKIVLDDDGTEYILRNVNIGTRNGELYIGDHLL